MTNREVAEIVKAAERLHLDELERAMEILDRGVTVAEYQRFERRRTWRWLVVCLIVVAIVSTGCTWAVWTWGPPEQRAKQAGGGG